MEDDARQLILDTEHLRLLRIGYFISAGVHGLISLFVIAYALFAFFVFSTIARRGSAEAPPEFIGRFIGFFGFAIAALIIGMGVLQYVTGQRLRDHRSRIFCLVIAAITCFSFPYGTFLGVCTFIVLNRPSVQRNFS